MRVILVGSPGERQQLKADLTLGAFEIIGEFATLGAARAAHLAADAVILPIQPTPDRGVMAERLTAREIEVLGLLVEGLSNKAIAGRLGISDQTVKFHVAAICGKLGAANRTDAVRRALRRGLISI
jgi:ATP/maltotriose-dependent transcriptional regulator MalT